jgi:hypothetical protein
MLVRKLAERSKGLLLRRQPQGWTYPGQKLEQNRVGAWSVLPLDLSL